MIKKAFKIILAVLAITSILFTIFFGYSMIEQYRESVRWKSSSLLSNIHNVPPALAKNYVTGDEEELTQSLVDVDNALKDIEKSKGIPKDELELYEEYYNKANELIKKHGLEKDKISNPSNSLSLYIQAEKIIDEAYREVSIEKLSEYSDKFVDRLNKKDNKIDIIYLEKLSTVSQDYKDLEIFSKNALETLGVFNGDTLYVDLKVDKSITQKILTEISDKKLLRFSNTRRLDTLLRDTPWVDILEHNESTKRYYSWKESKDILEALMATSYRSVSSFETLEDVLNYNPYMKVNVPEGYEVDRDSKVKNVYYQGNLVDKDQYIKKGIHLTFDIDYTYTELEIEEEIIDIEWDDEETFYPDDTPIKVPDIKPEDKPNKDSKDETDEDDEDEEIFQDGIGDIIEDDQSIKDKIEDTPAKP